MGWSARRGRRLDPPGWGRRPSRRPARPASHCGPAEARFKGREKKAPRRAARVTVTTAVTRAGVALSVRGHSVQKCKGASRFPGHGGPAVGRQTGRGTRQGSRALTDRRRQVRRQVRGTRVQTAGGARPCRAPSRSLPQDPREHPRGPSAVLGSGGEAGNHTAPPGVTVSCHKHVSGTCSQTLPGGGAEGAAWVPVSCQHPERRPPPEGPRLGGPVSAGLLGHARLPGQRSLAPGVRAEPCAGGQQCGSSRSLSLPEDPVLTPGLPGSPPAVRDPQSRVQSPLCHVRGHICGSQD